MQVPEVWLWVSGVFFAFGIISYLVFIVVLLKLQSTVSDLKPKMEKLAEDAKATSNRVSEVAKNVEGTTSMIRGKTEHILGTAVGAVETVAGRMATVSTILGLIVAAAKAKGELARIKDRREESRRRQRDPEEAE